jgi:F-type H+-transporting ATPase subunit beta
MNSTDRLNKNNVGLVTAVKGSVFDVRFIDDLPQIYSVLHIGDDDKQKMVLKVHTHLDAQAVRCIALTPTEGLSRGTEVINTGQPLKVPVGKTILSRMFNVFSKPIDQQPPPEDVEWRSVHNNPPPLRVVRHTRKYSPQVLKLLMFYYR